MALITAISLAGSGQRAANPTVATASDTIVFNPQNTPILHINNITGGAVTLSISGDASTTVGLPGVGDIDVSSSPTLAAIPAGDAAVIPLNSIAEYLKGTVTLTGIDGAEVTLMES